MMGLWEAFHAACPRSAAQPATNCGPFVDVSIASPHHRASCNAGFAVLLTRKLLTGVSSLPASEREKESVRLRVRG